MLELLVIDGALGAALIMVAAFVMVRRWRHSRGQRPMTGSERRWAAAAQAGDGIVRRATAIVPGFSDDTARPDLAGHVLAGPPQAEQSRVSGLTGPEPGSGRPGSEPDGQQEAASAVIWSERISSYYDEADQPMADYLAALGWPREAGHPRPQ
jgi:hypothetical protein